MPKTTHPSGPNLDAACVCGRLRRAARALTQHYDDAMASSGMRVTQFSLLRTLDRHGPLRINALAERALLDRTALSRNVDPLVAAGWVRVAPGSDARTREVALTRAGSAALKRATTLWSQAQFDVTQRLGANDSMALVALLARVEALHPDAASRASTSNSAGADA